MAKTRTDKRMGSIWEPVEATPEEIAKACMQGPPKETWDYLNRSEKQKEENC